MQVQLIVTNERQNGQTISVDVPAFKIGRAKDCHLRSNSSRISRQHCMIYAHDGVVKIQDLGSKTGTVVNGKPISSPQELKDGDELTVGKHVFAVSIKTDGAQPGRPNEIFELVSDSAVGSTTDSEQDAKIMFEVRHKGQSISVTKERLLRMARNGAITPDCVITVAGTKVFADTIQGIVFGKETPAVATPSHTETYNSESYTVSTSVALPPANTPIVDTIIPFDVTNEPSIPIARVPGARKAMTFSDLGKPFEEPLNHVSTWVRDHVTSRHVKIGGGVFATLCLPVFLATWSWSNSHGMVHIVGTVTLDDKPDPVTSGLAPINVEAKGKRHFSFELSSAPRIAAVTTAEVSLHYDQSW